MGSLINANNSASLHSRSKSDVCSMSHALQTLTNNCLVRSSREAAAAAAALLVVVVEVGDEVVGDVGEVQPSSSVPLSTSSGSVRGESSCVREVVAAEKVLLACLRCGGGEADAIEPVLLRVVKRRMKSSDGGDDGREVLEFDVAVGGLAAGELSVLAMTRMGIGDEGTGDAVSVASES
jgi:hypothetical protein